MGSSSLEVWVDFGWQWRKPGSPAERMRLSQLWHCRLFGWGLSWAALPSTHWMSAAPLPPYHCARQFTGNDHSGWRWGDHPKRLPTCYFVWHAPPGGSCWHSAPGNPVPLPFLSSTSYYTTRRNTVSLKSFSVIHCLHHTQPRGLSLHNDYYFKCAAVPM